MFLKLMAPFYSFQVNALCQIITVTKVLSLIKSKCWGSNPSRYDSEAESIAMSFQNDQEDVSL